MVQLWLQWYFLKFWAPNLEFLEGIAPARILLETSPTNHLPCLPLFLQSLSKSGKLGVGCLCAQEVPMVLRPDLSRCFWKGCQRSLQREIHKLHPIMGPGLGNAG
ncbi:hypothetical protein ACFX2F_014714 [Malus domestica]